jgi:hypothetical protein
MIKLQELQIHPSFNVYLLISKSVMFFIPLNFSQLYLHDCSTSDAGIFGHIGVIQYKDCFPEVLRIHPEISCIFTIFSIDFGLPYYPIK